MSTDLFGAELASFRRDLHNVRVGQLLTSANIILHLTIGSIVPNDGLS
jgi:hypothetical protein